MGVRIMGDVEPVAGKAFSEVGGCQHLVNEFGVGVRARVIEEGFDSFRGRRQAMEAERKPADEGTAVGAGGWGEVVFRTFGLEETVDGGFGGDVLEGLPSPVPEPAVFVGGQSKGQEEKK
jgi:hypothetical protein